MTVKDAVEASVLFTKSQKASAIAQGFYTTVVGSSTGAMKLFRIALVSTGIGAIVVGLGLLIANFDKVKKVILNLIPGLAKVGEFIENIVQSVTDFVGVTSDASRELEKLGEEANKTLERNKFFLEAYGDKYDEYTKRKIEANNKYAESVKAINEDETLSEEEKLKRLNLLRERANRDIADAENDRNEMLAKKRKEAQDKIDEENKKIAEKEKADREKKAEEEKKRAEEAKKKAEEDRNALNQFIIKSNDAETENKELNKAYQQEILDQAVKEFEDAETKRTETEQAEANKRALIEESLSNAKVNLANQTFDILSQLAKEGSALSKGIAVAQATMNTYQGVTAALSAVSVIPDPIGSALKFANAGLIGVQGLLNVKKILATKPVETSAGGGASIVIK
jgi:DNA repair exonuclease SbcCD ATPase subunit